jgi:hypothetical protein
VAIALAWEYRGRQSAYLSGCKDVGPIQLRIPQGNADVQEELQLLRDYLRDEGLTLKARTLLGHVNGEPPPAWVEYPRHITESQAGHLVSAAIEHLGLTRVEIA